jgi:hypothetical protein
MTPQIGPFTTEGAFLLAQAELGTRVYRETFQGTSRPLEILISASSIANIKSWTKGKPMAIFRSLSQMEREFSIQSNAFSYAGIPQSGKIFVLGS